jgi:bifunctional polynucleotide phosphatase/kinase
MENTITHNGANVPATVVNASHNGGLNGALADIISAVLTAVSGAAPGGHAATRGPERVWEPLEGGQAYVSFGTQAGGPPAAGKVVAAFDYDGTLVPFRGRGPARELTQRVLYNLATHGGSYRVVILSNRGAGLAPAEDPLRQYVAELDALTGGPRIDAYAAVGEKLRKPHAGLWRLVEQRFRPSRASFFCGDAAGRPGDFAATDYGFALAAGVSFVTPEVIFGRGAGTEDASPRACAVPWPTPEALGCFWPTAPSKPGEAGSLSAGPQGPTVDQTIEEILAQSCPLAVILVGSPASGKSSFARRLVAAGERWSAKRGTNHRFVVCSQDVEKTDCKRAFSDALSSLRHAVADNTHATAAARADFLSRARKERALTVIVHLATPKKTCLALNAAREQRVPDVAIHAYWKRLEPPQQSECDILYDLPFRAAAQD